MFSWKEIVPHVYHLQFDDPYQLAMHFLRVQEYYESPRFYKQIFTLVDYMEWYAKEYGKGVFTYPTDWSAFNVPSQVLLEVYKSSTNIPDFNKYDRFMSAWIDHALYQEQGHPFYFIGTCTQSEKKQQDIDHELAHALFYVDSEYRHNVLRCLHRWAGWPDIEPCGHKHDYSQYHAAEEALRKMGYHSSTIVDEIQAYSATGLCEELGGIITPAQRRPFQKMFREAMHVLSSTERSC